MKHGMTMAAVVGGMAMSGLAAGCMQDGAGRVGLTQAQLEAAIDDGGARVEVTLADDGSVREVAVDDEGVGHADQIEDRVVAFDGATIELEQLGDVSLAGVTRYRDESESHQDAAVWAAGIEAALAAGTPVWLRADGSFGADAFAAVDVRREDELRRPRLEGDVTPGDFDAASGTITIGGVTFELGDASIASDDGLGDDSLDDVGDDHGGGGEAEPGDDHGGGGEAEPGDDHGGGGEAEPGDDHGGDD